MDELSVIILLFIFSSLLYLFELAWIWGGLAQNRTLLEPDYSTPLTLIIAARDEEYNLRKYLPIWLSQNHRAYEVMVVNDCSDDDTEFVLAEFQRKYPHLQVINLQESNIFKGGKKYALSLGIKGAQFERLIFSDADCKPASSDYLALMSAQFAKDKEIVLGFGHYIKTKGFLNYLIRMDTIQIAIQYLGLAERGFPYMGVGRNLAYYKGVFFEIGGFKKHQDLKWGDDDLFINQVATKNNTVVCATPDAITFSKARESFSSWITQKRRHMSTAVKYKLSTKVLLAIKPIRIVAYYSVLTLGLLHNDLLISFLISALILYLTHSLIFIALNKKIGQVENAAFFPIIELFLFLVNLLIYISTWLKKPTKWT
jgi:cellulose synthase/poly-beta-1,6-N-acetylglucosamine synthase-like glycosyltransferase